MSRETLVAMARQRDSKGVELQAFEISHSGTRTESPAQALFIDCCQEYGGCTGSVKDVDGNTLAWVFAKCVKGKEGKECGILITEVEFMEYT